MEALRPAFSESLLQPSWQKRIPAERPDCYNVLTSRSPNVDAALTGDIPDETIHFRQT